VIIQEILSFLKDFLLVTPGEFLQTFERLYLERSEED